MRFQYINWLSDKLAFHYKLPRRDAILLGDNQKDKVNKISPINH